MSSTRVRRRSRGRAAEFLQKPRGLVHPRVQKVGPEHFGMVTVDPAKARSKWMLCDFYGKLLIPPQLVAHNRVVHPFATKQFRQPADPGIKSDDADLAAIHRAAVNGFALVEAEAEELWRRLQLLIRHRRSLVQKSSALSCQ